LFDIVKNGKNAKSDWYFSNPKKITKPILKNIGLISSLYFPFSRRLTKKRYLNDESSIPYLPQQTTSLSSSLISTMSVAPQYFILTLACDVRIQNAQVPLSEKKRMFTGVRFTGTTALTPAVFQIQRRWIVMDVNGAKYEKALNILKIRFRRKERVYTRTRV
jgi:hypothetical protein